MRKGNEQGLLSAFLLNAHYKTSCLFTWVCSFDKLNNYNNSNTKVRKLKSPSSYKTSSYTSFLRGDTPSAINIAIIKTLIGIKH